MVNLEKDILYVGVPLCGYSSIIEIKPYKAILIEEFGAIDYSVWNY